MGVLLNIRIGGKSWSVCSSHPDPMWVVFAHYIRLRATGTRLEHDDCHSNDVEYVLSNTPELHRSSNSTIGDHIAPDIARYGCPALRYYGWRWTVENDEEIRQRDSVVDGFQTVRTFTMEIICRDAITLFGMLVRS